MHIKIGGNHMTEASTLLGYFCQLVIQRVSMSKFLFGSFLLYIIECFGMKFVFDSMDVLRQVVLSVSVPVKCIYSGTTMKTWKQRVCSVWVTVWDLTLDFAFIYGPRFKLASCTQVLFPKSLVSDRQYLISFSGSEFLNPRTYMSQPFHFIPACTSNLLTPPIHYSIPNNLPFLGISSQYQTFIIVYLIEWKFIYL